MCEADIYNKTFFDEVVEQLYLYMDSLKVDFYCDPYTVQEGTFDLNVALGEANKYRADIKGTYKMETEIIDGDLYIDKKLSRITVTSAEVEALDYWTGELLHKTVFYPTSLKLIGEQALYKL